MQIKGLSHVHSNFSDGDLSLEEIKEIAQKLGVSFVLMADHMEQLGSQEKVQEMIEKCQQLSGEDFLIIPGFEVSPKRDYHVLVYNGRQFINHNPSRQDIIDSSFSEDQFLVLAHASQYPGKLSLELAKKLDGVEVWNARYDSRYAPNLKAYNCLKNTDLVALAGLDAHSEAGFKKLWIEMDLEKLNTEEIFRALREKRFKINNGISLIDINQPFTLSQKIFFTSINYLLAPLRIPYAILAKLGIDFPPFLKKIFHKFF